MKQFALYTSLSSLAVALTAVCVIALVGLPLGVAFTGGTSVEFSYGEPTDIRVIKNEVGSVVKDVEVIDRGGGAYRVMFQDTAISDTQEQITEALQRAGGALEIEQFTSVGPHISGEMGVKALVALLAAFGIIVGFVAYAFASVSLTFPSWKYGTIALATLVYDVIVSVGIFSIFGYVYAVRIDLLFVTAMLALIGYSINDTLVIFDRIRMYVSRKGAVFENAVWKGARTSLRRSIYTSVTTITPLVVLACTVPLIKWFAIALIIGIIVGTYSSLLFAPGLLALWYRHSSPVLSGKKESEVERAERELMERLKKGDFDTL